MEQTSFMYAQLHCWTVGTVLRLWRQIRAVNNAPLVEYVSLCTVTGEAIKTFNMSRTEILRSKEAVNYGFLN
jgi:hypothetical protein